MSRLLVVPAAGLGTRLGAALPKVLVPVAGVAMINRVLALYRGHVARAAIIVSPAALDPVQRHLAGHDPGYAVEMLVQQRPTGMLDAIVLAQPLARTLAVSHVWVTWCDQVGVHPRTIRRLAELTKPADRNPLVLPTVRSEHPYIHFERDRHGRITRVLHRREGDAMPAEGESDMGLFAMTAATFVGDLSAYAAEVETGQGTGERNFLPFIPWLAARGEVVTFAAEEPIEALGINTPEDLRVMESYLAAR
jgi:bifunctional N-acetylglucosamine-1-phosphate-uridyltransferase/glucosamine-1-phosphate-acetyltransferase GlmU-like protein